MTVTFDGDGDGDGDGVDGGGYGNGGSDGIRHSRYCGRSKKKLRGEREGEKQESLTRSPLSAFEAK